MKAFITLIKRDLRLSFARGSDAMVTLFFFVLVASLFPFALGGDQIIIKKAATGIIWIAAVLSALLSLENIYHRDYEDGSFEPTVTLNIPLAGLKIANSLLPPKVKEQMVAQGIDLGEILKQVDKGAKPATLLEVKDGGDHVIISLE